MLKVLRAFFEYFSSFYIEYYCSLIATGFSALWLATKVFVEVRIVLGLLIIVRFVLSKSCSKWRFLIFDPWRQSLLHWDFFSLAVPIPLVKLALRNLKSLWKLLQRAMWLPVLLLLELLLENFLQLFGQPVSLLSLPIFGVGLANLENWTDTAVHIRVLWEARPFSLNLIIKIFEVGIFPIFLLWECFHIFVLIWKTLFVSITRFNKHFIWAILV